MTREIPCSQSGIGQCCTLSANPTQHVTLDVLGSCQWVLTAVHQVWVCIQPCKATLYAATKALLLLLLLHGCP